MTDDDLRRVREILDQVAHSLELECSIHRASRLREALRILPAPEPTLEECVEELLAKVTPDYWVTNHDAMLDRLRAALARRREEQG